MESHPEEFERSLESRWYDTIGEINAWGNEADKAAIAVGLREIRLKEAHEYAMDELLNGPERRRKQAEDAEYERQMIVAAAKQRNTIQTSAQMAAQQYAAQQSLYDSQTQSFKPGIRGKSATLAILDEYANTTHTTNAANALQLGSEKLDETLLKKLKGLIK
jgi:hypothetical protein